MTQSAFDFAPEPSPPYAVESETSREAAELLKPSAEQLRARVYQFIVGRGGYGATDQEIQHALELDGSTERPRRWELVNAGLVRDSGTARLTATKRRATVWVAG